MSTPPTHVDRHDADTALIIVDMISDWQFEDGDTLLTVAHALAPRLKRLLDRCRRQGVVIIYANDNWGKWQSNFDEQLANAQRCGGMAADICHILAPERGDYIVLKPRHSAFYATPLQLILQRLDVKRLIITGMTTDQCVLITAIEAHMHQYDIWCPGDCVGTLTEERQARTLAHMQEVVGIRTDPGSATVLGFIRP